MMRMSGGMPVVELLTTGGTIAGAASSATSKNYQAASKSGEELLATVPGLAQLATLRIKSVLAKDSADLLMSDWLTLYNEVCRSVARPDVTAVVITHGTDTLEETAFFLDVLLRTDKPVVLVGAMRPATALSADGPLNLLNAVAVAVSPQSVGRGVLVVMNDSIMTARAVCKSHTTAVQAFTSPQLGGWAAGIGSVYWGEVSYVAEVSQLNSARSVPYPGWGVFDAEVDLPRVDILYLHAGMSVDGCLNASAAWPQGVVLAGTGAGNIPSYLHPVIRYWQSQGVVVVRSTRVWAGGVIPDYQELDSTLSLVSAGDLSPHKARILLMLLLRCSRDVSQLQRCFI